jgi:hypothetical protein
VRPLGPIPPGWGEPPGGRGAPRDFKVLVASVPRSMAPDCAVSNPVARARARVMRMGGGWEGLTVRSTKTQPRGKR